MSSTNEVRTSLKIRLVLAVLAILAAIFAPMLLKDEASPVIQSGQYIVTERLYSAPLYDFDYASLEDAPSYSISDTGELFERGALYGDEWHSYGVLEKIAFDSGSFLERFMDLQNGATMSGFKPGTVASHTVHAWRAESGNGTDEPAVSILILRLDDGSTLLAYGYSHEHELIRWVFRIENTASAK